MVTRIVPPVEQPSPAVRVTPPVEHEHLPVEAWAHRLASGDREGAWNALLDAYRGLIFSTIGRVVRDADDRMDVFALVCERLRDDDFRRLRTFDPVGPARFSSWLVTVVRNTAVDWHRRAHGRRHPRAFEERLPPVQRTLFQHLRGTGMTYVEAYESMRSAGTFQGPFAAFLREVRELYRRAFADVGPLARELVGSDPVFELAGEPVLPDDVDDDRERVLAALGTLPDDVHAATLLFVVDGVPAERVAQIVGWPNRKAVYNRVYRALALVRRHLEEEG